MTPERQRALARGEGCILLEEWREGWHFCQDFDLDLTDEKDETGRCPWCGFMGDLMPFPGASE